MDHGNSFTKDKVYRPVKTARRFRSFVWNFFEREEPAPGQTSSSARCTICQKKIKTSDASTTGLRTHLSNAHKIDGNTAVSQFHSTGGETATPTLKTSEIIARVVSESFINFNQLSTPAMRNIFVRAGHTLPTHPSLIREQFLKEFQSSCGVMNSMFENCVKDHQRFSISATECGTITGKRYLSILAHQTVGHFSLGMIRVIEGMATERVIELIDERLSIFGLNFENHIVCLITDGSDKSVMNSVGTKVSSLSQMCIMHGTHLAIRDCLYGTREGTLQSLEHSVNNFPDFEEEVDQDLEYDAELFPEQIEESFPSPIRLFDGYNLKADLLSLVERVCEAVKLLKSTQLRHENLLQPFVEEVFFKEIAHLCECSGNWNSLIKILQAFLDISKTVEAAYIDVGVMFPFEDGELNKIEEIINALKPLEHMSTMACREDASLTKADQLMKFTLTVLEKLASATSMQLKTHLRSRYLERRNTTLIQLLNLLENADFLKNERDLFGYKVKKEVIVHCADQLVKRIFPTVKTEAVDTNGLHNNFNDDPITNTSSSTLDVSVAKSTKQSFEESFNMWVNNQQPQRQGDQICETYTECLINDYISTKKLPQVLLQLKNCLLTIKPTAVDCDRSFSILNRFVTKDRTSLNDNTIDGLMFLRKFYSIYKSSPGFPTTPVAKIRNELPPVKLTVDKIPSQLKWNEM